MSPMNKRWTTSSTEEETRTQESSQVEKTAHQTPLPKSPTNNETFTSNATEESGTNSNSTSDYMLTNSIVADTNQAHNYETQTGTVFDNQNSHNTGTVLDDHNSHTQSQANHNTGTVQDNHNSPTLNNNMYYYTRHLRQRSNTENNQTTRQHVQSIRSSINRTPRHQHTQQHQRLPQTQARTPPSNDAQQTSAAQNTPPNKERHWGPELLLPRPKRTERIVLANVNGIPHNPILQHQLFEQLAALQGMIYGITETKMDTTQQ